jgi:amphi-Trp domain-containing protein
MQATKGDEIIVRGNQVGAADRRGVIVDVRGAGGAPPYMVRWSDGHEDLFFPSSDASITHPEHGEQVDRVADETQQADRVGDDEQQQAEPVSTGKHKRKGSMSRDEASLLLMALGNALARSGDVMIELEGETLELGSPSTVDVELAVKAGHKRVEVEIELEWSTQEQEVEQA